MSSVWAHCLFVRDLGPGRFLVAPGDLLIECAKESEHRGEHRNEEGTIAFSGGDDREWCPSRTIAETYPKGPIGIERCNLPSGHDEEWHQDMTGTHKWR